VAKDEAYKNIAKVDKLKINYPRLDICYLQTTSTIEELNNRERDIYVIKEHISVE
jgi:hypothetical protein